MAGEILTYRDALRDFINGQAYSEAVFASSRNVVSWDAEKVASLRCFVTPIDRQLVGATRSDYDFLIRVAFNLIQSLKELTLSDQIARQDQLITLSDEIAESVPKARGAVAPGVSFIRDAELPAAPMELETMHASGVFATQYRFAIRIAG